MPSAWSASPKPLSEKLYAALHVAFNRVAKRAYERGYEDGKAKRKADPKSVEVQMHTIKRIKSL